MADEAVHSGNAGLIVETLQMRQHGMVQRRLNVRRKRQRDRAPVEKSPHLRAVAGRRVTPRHALDAQSPQHVVERAVLHHDDDDVLDG